MGSLMAGWDSNTLDPKSASLERNRSLTKEEIDAFWKSKKETEDQHLKAISNLSRNIQPGKYEDNVPLPRRIKESLGMDADNNLDQLIKKNPWWTKSNWAFLNEPPVIEASSNKYASQFHIAKLRSSKDNPEHGISA
ncbi:uncharacterized protein [Cicer arietinum]|uniref:Uncharacterized protein LOC101501386 n=1 Tax=Cicer arietinum TaxID=3827 RepID=A0A1S2Y889_CICAR|nr:uncharacterized protein LOC101501386 [Cicer arietinum]